MEQPIVKRLKRGGIFCLVLGILTPFLGLILKYPSYATLINTVFYITVGSTFIYLSWSLSRDSNK